MSRPEFPELPFGFPHAGGRSMPGVLSQARRLEAVEALARQAMGGAAGKILGYAQRTSNFTLTASLTAITDLTGVTVIDPPNDVWVEAYFRSRANAGASLITAEIRWNPSNQAAIARWTLGNNFYGEINPKQKIPKWTGSRTFFVAASSSAGSTSQGVEANSTFPAWLAITDAGS